LLSYFSIIGAEVVDCRLARLINI